MSIAAGCEVGLAVLSGYDEVDNCLIVVDSSVQTNLPVAGDFFFVVDGLRGSTCPFAITFTEIPNTPVNFCQYVQPLDCTGYIENSLENHYSVSVPPGGSFGAVVTYPQRDAAIAVFDACAEPLTCLAGADYTTTGDAKLVPYTNSDVATKTLYVAIDSYGSNTCGGFTCTIQCNQGTVGVDPAGWGNAKRLRR